MREIVFLARAKRLPRIKADTEKSGGVIPVTPIALPARTHDEIRQTAQTEILLAAESVFARVGFSGATIAEIAARAGLPKANLHYYYRTKAQLYRAVLDNTLKLWLAGVSGITKSAHPAVALSAYIHGKMRLTASHPDASRVFANEMLHGAPEISGYLQQELKALIDEKAQVIAHWAKLGLMDKVDARHLFFTIWAATQTYADFQPQVCAVLGKAELSEADYEHAAQQLVRVLLKGCGVEGVAER
jgi:TetR/AcrR family transcriptional regulator